jgi:hypothetical protein
MAGTRGRVFVAAALDRGGSVADRRLDGRSAQPIDQDRHRAVAGAALKDRTGGDQPRRAHPRRESSQGRGGAAGINNAQPFGLT